MKLLVLGILLLARACAADSTCVYPPCQADEHGDQAAVGEGQCCQRNSQDLAAVHRNLSALWYTVAEFREVVARHLHHLHEHQVMMFSHQMTGAAPVVHSHQHAQQSNSSDSQYRSSRRYKRPRRPYSRRYQQPQPDPFHGLDRTPVPRAWAKLPAVREPEEFDLGICHMRPNSAVPESRVHGQVLFYQKKNSETLYMHVMLTGFAPSVPQLVVPSLDGQSEEERAFPHGLHIHDKPDFSQGCESAGPHYNPYHLAHGGPHSTVRHIGDFGNVDVDSEGNVNELIEDEVASLRGEHSVFGKPMVVHARKDDLGTHPNDPESTSTGNSGARMACCIVERLPRAGNLQQAGEDLFPEDDSGHQEDHVHGQQEDHAHGQQQQEDHAHAQDHA